MSGPSRSAPFVAALLLAVAPTGPAASAVSAQNVLVVYHSVTDHTRLMAEAVADGAREVRGADVRVLPVDGVATDDLVWADALVLGGPVRSANVSAEVAGFLATLPFDGGMKEKVGAAFSTGGGISAGEELALVATLHAMLMYGMIVVGGPDWTSAFGASAVTGEAPFTDPSGGVRVAPAFLDKARALGRRV
ncbi:MAG TPA: NAD(P)H-dependent oxidoreductase, partial [Longimicrobiales bacterium]|nr:NAD(P)H-dependent oxidoreductase [Longimicrobiales bacterium]